MSILKNSAVVCFLFSALFFFTVSCKRSAKEEVKPSDDKETLEVTRTVKPGEENPAAKTTSKTTSEIDLSEEAIEVAKQFEKAIAEGDKEFLRPFLDLEGVIVRSFDGIKLPNGFMQGVREGMAQGQERMLNDFISAKFDYIKLVSGGKEPVVRFRIRRDGGIDYGDYHFGKDTDGQWKIVDTHIYSIGTKLSDLLRDSVTPMLAELDKSLLTRFLKGGSRGEHFDNAPKVRQIMMLARAGNEESAQQAATLYDGLPKSVQETKLTMLMYMMATTNLPDFTDEGSRYQKALERFEKTFPNDPSAALHAIDINILRKDFDATHKVVDKLKDITEDDYLEFYKGYIHMHEGKFDEVEKSARYWIEQEPYDVEGWEMLLEAGFGSDRHAVTVEALKRLEADFEQDYSAVSSTPDWSTFFNSPEGKQWWAARGN